jgi:hypothetical protein
LLKCENPSGNIGLATLMLFPVCGSITGLASTFYKGKNAIKECLISSGAVSFLLVAIGLIVSKGKISVSILINIAIFTLSSIVVAYISRPKRRRR